MFTPDKKWYENVSPEQVAFAKRTLANLGITGWPQADIIDAWFNGPKEHARWLVRCTLERPEANDNLSRACTRLCEAATLETMLAEAFMVCGDGCERIMREVQDNLCDDLRELGYCSTNDLYNEIVSRVSEGSVRWVTGYLQDLDREF